MRKDGVDLLNPTGLEKIDYEQALIQLRRDFDSHNHDGSNSSRILNLIVDTLQARSAIIGGYKLFEAVVAKQGGDFTSVAAALKAGRTRIFVRNGNYTFDPCWTISNANTIIVGESTAGVNITFAQDLVNSGKSIYVNATRFICQNMRLTSFDSVEQTLFHFTASGTYPKCTDLMVGSSRGKCFDSDPGSGAGVTLFGTFENIYIDMTFTNDITKMIGFSLINSSAVKNVYFDMGALSSTGGLLVKNCSQTTFSQCRLRATHASNEPKIDTTSAETEWIGCYFYCTGITADSNFTECMFESNGNTPAGYFVTTDSINSRFNACRFKDPDNDINFFTSSASGIQVNGCFFNGGKKILLTGGIVVYGGIFSNNIWVSTYTVAAIDLQLAANTTKWNSIGNTLRNATNMPTVTDSGTTNNVSSNQVILA